MLQRGDLRAGVLAVQRYVSSSQFIRIGGNKLKVVLKIVQSKRLIVIYISMHGLRKVMMLDGGIDLEK